MSQLKSNNQGMKRKKCAQHVWKINRNTNVTTGISPFFANKGYNLAITIHMEYNLVSSKAQNFVTNLSELHEELQKAIVLSQEHYQISADRN